jgi:hypothetical protein
LRKFLLERRDALRNRVIIALRRARRRGFGRALLKSDVAR